MSHVFPVSHTDHRFAAGFEVPSVWTLGGGACLIASLVGHEVWGYRAGRRASNAADSITAKQHHNLSLEVQPGEAVVEGQADNGVVQRLKAAKQQQRQQYEVAVVQPGEAAVV